LFLKIAEIDHLEDLGADGRIMLE